MKKQKSTYQGHPCLLNFFQYVFIPDLKHERKKRSKEYRVLLLGCGEAGKSTFIKQGSILFKITLIVENVLQWAKKQNRSFSNEEKYVHNLKQDDFYNYITIIVNFI